MFWFSRLKMSKKSFVKFKSKCNDSKHFSSLCVAFMQHEETLKNNIMRLNKILSTQVNGLKRETWKLVELPSVANSMKEKQSQHENRKKHGIVLKTLKSFDSVLYQRLFLDYTN